MPGVLVTTVQVPSGTVAALSKTNAGGFVGQTSATKFPFRAMSSGGRNGVVTEAQVKPTRSSSAVSFSGPEVLLAARKKTRSIWARSVPPLPMSGMVAAGGVAAPKVELEGL